MHLFGLSFSACWLVLANEDWAIMTAVTSVAIRNLMKNSQEENICGRDEEGTKQTYGRERESEENLRGTGNKLTE